jgi:hypothetical protein
MINQYSIRTALTLLACITITFTTDASYASIQERQAAAIAQYKALLAKWQPALDNPSDATLNTVIKKKSAALKQECNNAQTESDIKAIKSIQDDLKALPVQFMCNELDKDIKTIFSLQDTARILNMNYAFDASPFQDLRAAIDGLPCTATELQARERMGTMYKYFLVFLGGTLAAKHFSLWPFNAPSNA